MKIAILTPTRQCGGLDVVHNSIMRQDALRDHKVRWIVGDELARKRQHAYARIERSGVDVVHFDTSPLRPEGYYSNLPGIYNEMLERAQAWGAHLAVSVQDYFWLPEDGLRKFVELHEREPRMLITGVAHLVDNPGRDAVTNPYGGYTIFDEPYVGPPEMSFWWRDVRADVNYAAAPEGTVILGIPPQEWELNWAAIPMAAFDDTGFDAGYGEHIGYENVAYACMLAEHGWECALDLNNVAYGLPHKVYWPQQEKEGYPHSLVNKERCEAQWGDVMSAGRMRLMELVS